MTSERIMICHSGRASVGSGSVCWAWTSAVLAILRSGWKIVKSWGG